MKYSFIVLPRGDGRPFFTGRSSFREVKNKFFHNGESVPHDVVRAIVTSHCAEARNTCGHFRDTDVQMVVKVQS